MMRILFWIALVVLVVMAVRAKLKGASVRHQAPARPPARQAPARIETMTQCAHCGLHFPASEAVHADGLDYCSPGHVRLPPQ
jgi:uncharacterized protein